MEFSVVLGGDFHFGHKGTEHMFNEERHIFLNHINETKPKVIIITGDYFDRKLVGSEPSMLYATRFFGEIVELALELNIKIRVIQGTRSHDINQLNTILQHYEKTKGLDIKFIFTIQTENLFGMRVLYIPEEYPEDHVSYYESYKNGEYDLIAGHGTWDFVAFENQISENEREGHKAPVFMFKEWEDAIKGAVVFGHIHGRNTYKKKIFYPGSYSRWAFGERSTKGFTHLDFNSETSEVNVKFIDNTAAPQFEVYDFKGLFDSEALENMTSEALKETIDTFLEEKDNIRVDLSGLSEDKIQILRNAYRGEENVKLEVRDNKKLLKESNEEILYEKYDYILDNTLPLAETILKYIKEEFNDQEITIDEIRNLLEEEVELT